MTHDEHLARSAFLLFILMWAVCAILSAGFINASYRATFPTLIQSPRNAVVNRNIAIAVGIAGGPFTLFASAIVTGLFYDGWTLRADPAPCTMDPHIWCEP